MSTTPSIIKCSMILLEEQEPDVSVLSCLLCLVMNASVTWRVGALMACSHISPNGHCLTRQQVSECVKTSCRIRGLDFFIALELPGQDDSVIVQVKSQEKMGHNR